VTNKITYNAETVFLSMLLDDKTNITNPTSGFRFSNSKIKTFFGYLQ
jgi:hypothetical protein